MFTEAAFKAIVESMPYHTCTESAASPIVVWFKGVWLLNDGSHVLGPIRHCPWCGDGLPEMHEIK